MVSVTEGNSVTLKTGATEIQRDDEVLWKFGPQDLVIAQIHKKAGNISYADDERFRDKLQLDQQTGDLTISDIRIRISGDYHLQITSSKATKTKRFKVIVRVNTLKYTVGDSVILQTGVTELKNDDRILWKFSDKDTFIAELNGATNQTLFYKGPDGRFRDRLQINQQTGDLTIRNISRAHSDVYTLKITRGKKSTCKRFMVVAHGE
ncbi:hypothetical protein DPX16_4340 [Anabarilius grahami]|uniref:Immunoglobulin domain-containing protein n=1 Tax=Anabarilius grahami TaxID=495550 RepID=A0A3N0YSV9_ANAGA|nr:hypothetical protein DPX16_4340 [Anabarilius grahami]